MPWVYYKMYRRYFTDVGFRFVMRNLPRVASTFARDGSRARQRPDDFKSRERQRPDCDTLTARGHPRRAVAL